MSLRHQTSLVSPQPIKCLRILSGESVNNRGELGETRDRKRRPNRRPPRTRLRADVRGRSCWPIERTSGRPAPEENRRIGERSLLRPIAVSSTLGDLLELTSQAAAGNGIFVVGDRRPKTCLRDETCGLALGCRSRCALSPSLMRVVRHVSSFACRADLLLRAKHL